MSTTTNETKPPQTEAIKSGNWFCNLFRRKQKIEPIPTRQKEREKEWWEDDWKEVIRQYPIGHTFLYLRRDMMVTEYINERELNISPMMDFLIVIPPEMSAEYSDINGRLHKWKFGVQMIPVLLQNIKADFCKTRRADIQPGEKP